MKSLKSQYPTWKQLSEFLTSEEGGAFRVRECGGDSPYAIISYKKGSTKISDETESLRSVVWDMQKHIPVSVAPSKAKSGFPPCATPLRVEEFLDGVMINAFMVAGDSNVHVASRSQYNASGTFYSKKTFYELFKEALPTETLEDLFSGITLSEENPAFYASFVLQHPEHRVVYRPPKPAIFLVGAGMVAADGTVNTNPPLPLPLAKCVNTPLSQETVFATQDEMIELLKNESLKRGWTWQGLVFHDAAGGRWRLRNPTYCYLRSLRGNEPQPETRFLRLRSLGKIAEYLKHYSDERDLFWNYEQKLRTETHAVFDDYCSVHKAHEKKLADIPHPRKTLVFKLHSHYLDTLRPNKTPLQKKIVIDLVNSLPIWEQQLLLTSP